MIQSPSGLISAEAEPKPLFSLLLRRRAFAAFNLDHISPRMKPRLAGLAFLSLLSCTLATPDTTTLVDLLSASPHHSLLLRALQRARLVPTLNKLNGSTLWAPTDEAITKEIDREKQLAATTGDGGPLVWAWATADELQEQHDNLQLALKDTLLYHILNYTLFKAPKNGNDSETTHASPSSLPLGAITLQQTLYHPALSSYNKSFPAPPSLPGSPPDKPNPDAPQHYIEGLLRGEGQRVRAIRAEDGIRIGVDWRGQGGAKVEGKWQRARNGELVAIDAVLHKPVDLGASQSACDAVCTTF